MTRFPYLRIPLLAAAGLLGLAQPSFALAESSAARPFPWQPWAFVGLIALLFLGGRRIWYRRLPAASATADSPAGRSLHFGGEQTPAIVRSGMIVAMPGFLLLPAVAVPAALSLVLQAAAEGMRNQTAGTYGVIALWLAGLALFVYLMFVAPRQLLRKSRVHGLPVQGHLDERGVLVSSDVSRTDLTWGQLHSAALAVGSIVLFTVPYSGVHLHRSFFASDQDWEAAIQLVRDHVQKVREPARIGPKVLWTLLVLAALFVIVLLFNMFSS